MRWSKKAALELSINAIVVLILAITILGLGIAFIRGQFGALQEQFSSVSGEVKTELINKIKGSGELLVFNRAELDVQVGRKQSLFFGIKNNREKKVCTATTVRCLKALKPSNQKYCVGDPVKKITPQLSNGGITGGAGCTTTAKCQKWFNVLTPIDIEQGEVGVFPMEVQISDAKPDTYLMKVEVLVSSANLDCSELENNKADLEQPWNLDGVTKVPTSAKTTWDVLATKQFTINLQ